MAETPGDDSFRKDYLLARIICAEGKLRGIAIHTRDRQTTMLGRSRFGIKEHRKFPRDFSDRTWSDVGNTLAKEPRKADVDLVAVALHLR